MCVFDSIAEGKSDLQFPLTQPNFAVMVNKKVWVYNAQQFQKAFEFIQPSLALFGEISFFNVYIKLVEISSTVGKQKLFDKL